MTPEQAKYLLPILKAYSEGKTIQFFNDNFAEWIDLKETAFHFPPDQYRIKPDPIVVKYRRFIWQQGSSNTYYVATVHLDAYNTSVKHIEGSSSFVRWIDTDWVSEVV